MKKYCIVSLAMVFPLVAKTQNVQMHYDFGEDRKMFTSTVEMLKRDNYGCSFFFIDFDYGSKSSNVDGVSRAYMEISRELKFWNPPFAIEQNLMGVYLEQKLAVAQLTILTYSVAPILTTTKILSRVFSTQLLYKYIKNVNDLAFQITITWGLHFFNKKLSLTGFADFWRQDVSVFDDSGNKSSADFVFVSEPQIWYTFHSHFSVGSEVEVSNNFSGHKGFMVNPTLAMKWIF